MVEGIFIQRKCVLPLITILAADKLIFIFFVGFRKKSCMDDLARNLVQGENLL